MKVRHQRRAALAALAASSLLGGLAPMGPAEAAGRGQVAGTGTARTGGTPLNMRRAPYSAAERMGVVANGGTVWIVCQTTGDRITGAVRTTNLWNRLANNTYVSDAYVVRGSFAIPACPPAATVPAPTAPPPSASAWQLPLAAGLVSGFRTPQRPAHDGVDLAAARYTPIQAVAAGTVVRVVCNVSAGSCDVDGNPTLKGCGWYVEIQHPGNVVTRYCHLVRRPPVTVGQTVGKGQLICHVGTSGSSSGPHLHFEVHVGAPPATHANAVSPVEFMGAHGLAFR